MEALLKLKRQTFDQMYFITLAHISSKQLFYIFKGKIALLKLFNFPNKLITKKSI